MNCGTVKAMVSARERKIFRDPRARINSFDVTLLDAVARPASSLSPLRNATSQWRKKRRKELWRAKREIERQTQTRSRRHCVNNGKRHARTHARTHVCTHEGKQAQHGKGATSRGQAAGTGSKRGRVPPGKGEARPRQRGLRVLTTVLPPNSIVTSCFLLRSNKILFQDVIEKVSLYLHKY